MGKQFDNELTKMAEEMANERKRAQEMMAGYKEAAEQSKEMTRGLLAMKEQTPYMDQRHVVERWNNDMIEEIQAAKNAEMAVGFHDRLLEHVREFDQSLDPAHEVGVRLVSFGQSFTFHLREIGYHNPALIIFVGETDNGEPVKLIQHISQISVLLTKMKRPDPSAPKEPFGFHDKKQKANPDIGPEPLPNAVQG